MFSFIPPRPSFAIISPLYQLEETLSRSFKTNVCSMKRAEGRRDSGSLMVRGAPIVAPAASTSAEARQTIRRQ